MSDLLCPKCSKSFDDETHTPRMFACCGHTLCSACISDMIAASEDSFVRCPDTEDKCAPFKPDNGIESFMINKIVWNHVKKLRLDRPKHSIATGRTLCKDHDKPKDIVCLTDAEVVCSDCALFGSHKPHDFLPFLDFQRKTAEELKAIELRLVQLKKQPFAVNARTDVKTLREEIQAKFNDCMVQIDYEFAKISQEIANQKTDCVKSLEKVFEAFESKADEIALKSDANSTQLRLIEAQLAESREVNDRIGFEEIGFLERFCPRSKLNEMTESVEKSVDLLLKVKESEIFRKIDRIKVNSNFANLAPKLKGVVDVILDFEEQKTARGNEGGKVSDLSPERQFVAKKSLKSQPEVNLLSMGAEIVLEDDGFELFEAESNAFGGKAKVKTEQLLTSPNDGRIGGDLTPIMHKGMEHEFQRPAAASFIKKSTLPRPVPDVTPDPIPNMEAAAHASDKLLAKSEIESEKSLLDSPSHSESDDKSSHKLLTRSFILDRKKDSRHQLQGAAPGDNDELTKTQIQEKRKGSLLPNKKRDADNSFVATRDASPFTPLAYETSKTNPRNFKQSTAAFETQQRLQAPHSSASLSNQLPITDTVRNSATKLTRYQKDTEIEAEDDRLNTTDIIQTKKANFMKQSITSVKNKQLLINPSANQIPIEERMRKSSVGNRSANEITGEPRKPATMTNMKRIEKLEQNSPIFDTKVKTTLDNKLIHQFSDKTVPMGLFNKQLQSGLQQSSLSSNQTFNTLHANSQISQFHIEPQTNQTTKVHMKAPTTTPTEGHAEMLFIDRKINDANLQSLIPEIIKNKKARVLNLSNNFITEAGVESLVKKLAGHPTLETIVLKGNYIEDKVFDMLRANAKNLKKLNQFNFAENKTLKDRSKIKLMIAELRKLGIRVEV